MIRIMEVVDSVTIDMLWAALIGLDIVPQNLESAIGGLANRQDSDVDCN